MDIDHNSSDLQNRRGSSRPSLDPLERLPPEIFTLFIHFLISFDVNKAGRLIELSTIARRWQDFLFSTPLLWSEIYISESEPDVFACLAVSIHISGETPLTMICGQWSESNWPQLVSVLSTAYGRITRLKMEPSPVIQPDLPLDLYPQMITLSSFVSKVGFPPNLRELTLDFSWNPTIDEIQHLNLPSTLRLSCELQIYSSGEENAGATTSRLFDIDRYTLCHSTSRQTLLSTRLSVDFADGIERVSMLSEGTSLSQIKHSHEHVSALLSDGPNLDYTLSTSRSDIILPYEGGKRSTIWNIEWFMYHFAMSVRRLSVSIYLHHLADLIDCLGVLIGLEDLGIHISVLGDADPVDLTPGNVVNLELRRLGLTCSLWPDQHSESIQIPMRKLFLAFKTLYPGVKELTLDDSTLNLGSSYLQTLLSLKSLNLYLYDARLILKDQVIPTVVNAQSLKIYDLSYQLSSVIFAPNLLKLSVNGVKSNSYLVGGRFSHLYKLEIAFPESWQSTDFALYPSDYPSLMQLYLDMSRASNIRFRLSLLLRLVTVDIQYPQPFDNDAASELCLDLIHSPELLPALETLSFNVCPEWELLFLMLGGRNLLVPGVKRIHTVTTPFVPPQLQEQLGLLLDGSLLSLPNLSPFFREETREVICDPTIRGCLLCLQNMRSGCAVAVTDMHTGEQDFVWEEYEFNSDYGDEEEESKPYHVPDSSLVTSQWLERREHLTKRYWACLGAFESRFQRYYHCSRWLA